MKRLLHLCLIASFFLHTLTAPPSALAQSREGAVVVTAVDTSAFPEMRVYLAVADAEGNRLADLPDAAFALAENDAPVAGVTVSAQVVGAQVVFVLDPTAPFRARDVNAVTRLDYVKQALTDFAQTTPWMRDGVDDVTVLAPEGVLIAHSGEGARVAAALAAYATEFAGAADPLPLVHQALDFASDATARPGMRRYVVLLASGLTLAGGEAALNDLAVRATTAQVPIHTAFVGPAVAEGEETASIRNLRRLAELSGGSHMTFDSPTALTPLFQSLAEQRGQYLLRYRSALAVTGQHRLAVRVQLPEGPTLTSPESVFPLRVEPPVVTLPDVPDTIQRIAQEPGADPQTIEPVALDLSLQVDFPDGHARPLREVQWWIDGQPVGTSSGAARDTFTWRLADYGESGTHTVQVRVTDELGLTAESEVVAVTITLEVPPAPAASPLTRPETRGLAVFVVIGLLLAVNAALGGWLWYTRRGRVFGTRAPAGTAPLAAPPTPEAQTRPSPRLALPALRLPTRAARPRPQGRAYLEVLEPGGGGAPRDDIELLGPAVHLGRDAAQAEVVFHDRSVSRHHARIVEVAEGVFHIFDEGSTSGTWVNFAQIPAETGWELKPGDVINLGRVQLRFKRREPSEATTPSAIAREAPAPHLPPSDGSRAPNESGLTEPHRPADK